MVQSQEPPLRPQSLTVSRLAAAGGVGVETVRFYQRRGLLETPTRDGGIRRYGSQDVRRLHFIRSAQSAGFTLAEIAELLALDASDDRPRVRTLARERIARLDEKISELSQARVALASLAETCAKGGKGPCPIIGAFERGRGG